jgi:hypothetical protein
MPTNFSLAGNEADQIAKEIYNQILLQGYTVKLASTSSYLPVVQIKLDRLYLEKNQRYYGGSDDNYADVIRWEKTRTLCRCRTGGTKVNYTKDGGFPADQIIAAARAEAFRMVEREQIWLSEQTNKASSWPAIERLGQEFGDEQRSGIHMEPDKTRPNQIECRIFVGWQDDLTVGQAIKLLSSLPPDANMTLHQTFNLTEQQARAFFLSMQQYRKELPPKPEDAGSGG